VGGGEGWGGRRGKRGGEVGTTGDVQRCMFTSVDGWKRHTVNHIYKGKLVPVPDPPACEPGTETRRI